MVKRTMRFDQIGASLPHTQDFWLTLNMIAASSVAVALDVGASNKPR